MHRRAEVIQKRLQLREREGVVRRSELRSWKGLRDVGQDRRRFGDDAPVGHERWDPRLRVHREIVGLGLLGCRKIDTARLVFGARFFQRDMRSQ
ncbi:hypothetical protein D3C87_1967630 [compost metagenome]